MNEAETCYLSIRKRWVILVLYHIPGRLEKFHRVHKYIYTKNKIINHFISSVFGFLSLNII